MGRGAGGQQKARQRLARSGLERGEMLWGQEPLCLRRKSVLR